MASIVFTAPGWAELVLIGCGAGFAVWWIASPIIESKSAGK